MTKNMKRLLTVVALFCCCTLMQAQQAEAHIEFTGYEWNVGKFSKAETPLRGAVYPFKNTGDAPLIIKDVAPKCNCLIVDWIREPVPPGGKGWVKVIYDGRKQLPHYFNKAAVVHTNAPEGPHIWIHLEGEMTP